MPKSLSASTDSPEGSDRDGVIVTLALRSGTYDVEAVFTGQQLETQIITDWVLQNTVGSSGSGDDNFNTPNQVASDTSGGTYTADRGNGRLIRRDSAGVYVSQITGLTTTRGVCLDPSGNIYVTFGSGSGSIVLRKYNSSHVQQWSIAVTGTGISRHITTDGTNIYMTFADTVRKFRCSDGVEGTGWGSFGTSDGQFQTPWGICHDGTFVYVVDNINCRIQKFTLTGTFTAKWGSAGSGGGQFSSPIGIERDTAGNLWVADQDNNRLQRTSNTGTYQDEISQVSPHGIARATGDILWVSNVVSHNLAKWDESSTPGGYGQVAIEINGVLCPYTGIGNRDGAVANAATAVLDDPTSITVRAFAKATAGTMSLEGCVLSVKAVPRR